MHVRSTLLVLAIPAAASAQGPVRPASSAGMRWAASYETGGELESYLRALQLAGAAPSVAWSIRGLSPRQLARATPADTARHPWAWRFAPDAGEGADGREPRARWIAPSMGARLNSTIPWGMNDGAVWAGRGLTVWGSAGGAAHAGPLTIRVRPLAFVTQNLDVDIVPNGREGRYRFGWSEVSGEVDLPQRFGDGMYGALDPGSSSVRLDIASLALSFGTEHEWWGPAQEFPTILGTNAAGFAHVALGSAQPLDLWLFRVHGRVIWGQLDQSDYFSPLGPNAALVRPQRFATGAIVQIQPRGLDGLELGVQRFYHAPWPDEGLPGRYLGRVFENPFKKRIAFEETGHIPTDFQSIDGENQIAAAYARIAMPRAGFEMYMELGREDHSHDGRDLLVNPTDRGSTVFGFAKVWPHETGARLTRFRAEAMNFQTVQEEIYRGVGALYIHSSGANQGHTQRGQLLGAGIGVRSAAGAEIAMDRYDAQGRWTASWSRIVRRDRGAERGTQAQIARALDVVHTIEAERLAFRRGAAVSLGGYLQREFNRDFGRDVWNLGALVSLRRGAP